jgi:hypothetical protein
VLLGALAHRSTRSVRHGLGATREDGRARLAFYERLGFREAFRTPKAGTPCASRWAGRVTIGIADVDAAIADHGLSPNLGGRPVEIVLWTDDVGREYACLTDAGAPTLGTPYDFLSELR